MSDGRIIRVRALTRVEGEGGLHIRLRDGAAPEVQLEIYEPPRLFEALLRGRRLEEASDINARICGICPVAYQMSTVHALEAALDVRCGELVRRLRRLLYCGEWIESHSLHVHLLHAPDFLGYDGVADMAAEHREAVERGLRLKKHGNQLIAALGGRAIHPVNVAVGGFYRWPTRDELARLVPDFEWGLTAAVEAARWVAGFDFPALECPWECVALTHPDEYAMNEGRLGSSLGWSCETNDFERAFIETQVSHSTALHAHRAATGQPYLCGAISRLNLNRDRLSPTARRLADELGWETPCHNPFRSVVARMLEVVHAYEEALEILRGYAPSGPPRVRCEYRTASGAAATEAPRGLLYHRYDVLADGSIAAAKIVPPTSQNQAQIEADLRAFVPTLQPLPTDQWPRECENLVRSYDPCISCATHFLRVTVEGPP